MKHKETIQEHIIAVTSALIEQESGDVKRVTARMIAERAEIGLGLINYHFKSKDNLITICVQRIIADVVSGFRMQQEFDTDKARLTAWAAYVFEFLFAHPAIARISILGDFQNYTLQSNSVSSQKALALALTQEIAEQDKAILSFILTASMQAAFLAGCTAKELLGYDLTKPEDRSAYIKRLVTVLFEENRTGETL